MAKLKRFFDINKTFELVFCSGIYRLFAFKFQTSYYLKNSVELFYSNFAIHSVFILFASTKAGNWGVQKFCSAKHCKYLYLVKFECETINGCFIHNLQVSLSNKLILTEENAHAKISECLKVLGDATL